MANILVDKVNSIGGLVIEIWSEDLGHAISGHPEVTIEKIKETLSEPSKVIKSRSSNNACLFYSVELFTLRSRSYDMNLKYLPDNDLLYIYFESNIPNTQTRTSHDQIFKFVAKADKKHIVGYEVEKASKNLNSILTKLGLSSKQKLALCLYFIREREGKTQDQFANILHISLSKYKSLEKAEHNINFDTLESIFETFPNETILEKVFQKVG